MMTIENRFLEKCDDGEYLNIVSERISVGLHYFKSVSKSYTLILLSFFKILDTLKLSFRVFFLLHHVAKNCKGTMEFNQTPIQAPHNSAT